MHAERESFLRIYRLLHGVRTVRAMKFALRVIPKPAEDSRTVFITSSHEAGFLFFRGDREGVTHICGKCGRALMKGVDPGQVQDCVLRCPACGSYCDTRAVRGHD